MLVCPLVLLTSRHRQARTLYSPCRLQAPAGRGHTLPHSLAHWILYNPHDAPESHDTPLRARVFSVPNQSGSSDFLYLCLTHTCLTIRAGGQNTLWDTHLFHSLQRHLSVHDSYTPRALPDILCSAISSSSSSLPQSLLDGLELEPTYNPLQVWSHLYSHLSSTFAKPQSRLHPSWESRALRKVQLPSVLPSVLPSSSFMPRIQETPISHY